MKTNLTIDEYKVLDELRERSDDTHERRWVGEDEVPVLRLRLMWMKGLVRLTYVGDDPTDPFSRRRARAWITEEGIATLLAYESRV
jgi:hypothetical protein